MTFLIVFEVALGIDPIDFCKKISVKRVGSMHTAEKNGVPCDQGTGAFGNGGGDASCCELGIPPKFMVGSFHKKTPNLKWMKTGGSPK